MVRVVDFRLILVCESRPGSGLSGLAVFEGPVQTPPRTSETGDATAVLNRTCA